MKKLLGFLFLITNLGCAQPLGSISQFNDFSFAGPGGLGGTFPPVINPPVSGPINTANRNSVVAAFRNVYRATPVDMGWTGDVQNCIAGTTSIAYQQSVIDRVSYFRNMTGLPSITLSPSNNNFQNAALMMAANGQLSHSPPSSWKCYTAEGAGGAGASNLALGTNGPDAIDLYMQDWGSNNAAVGHRRWILLPTQTSMATGDVPGSNSLGVFMGGGPRPSDPAFVAWPSPGYFPSDILPNGSNRWSFSHPNAQLGGATVTMTNVNTGQNIPTILEPLSYGYGDGTLVWLPQGFNYSTPAQDTTYLVTINNLVINGVTQNISYTVTVINAN